MIGAKTTLRVTVIRNYDGVVVAPSIGQFFIARAAQQAAAPLANGSRDSALAIAHPLDLVELTGIEPVTSCLQSRRSPN